MEGPGLTEDFSDGTFIDAQGKRFVISQFDPDNPVPIAISGSVWSAIYKGQSITVDWDRLGDIPEELRNLFMNSCRLELKRHATNYMAKFFLMAMNFLDASQESQLQKFKDFSQLGTSDILKIWGILNSSDRIFFRSFYSELARKKIGGASLNLAREMKTWKARNKVVLLRYVVYWSPTKGAFIAAEWELIRNELEFEDDFKSEQVQAVKVFGRIVAETLKRPGQILSIKAKNGLMVIPSDEEGLPSEYFLRIPTAKAQTGAKPRLWQITEGLGKTILNYSKLPHVSRLQQVHDRLVVLPGEKGVDNCWTLNGQVTAQDAKSALQNYFKYRNLISPRTGERFHVTPYRIRHTGATALALQGFTRDDIQEVLEHDSPYSADAYIEAVGSDLMPALEKATNRGLGEVFSVLSDCYFFRGKVADEVGQKPILIPAVNLVEPETTAHKAPAVVGSCGKSGACSKHPFWACYNGCEHFLAWRDADHSQSLDYVTAELDRWSEAEGGKKRSKLYKDFDRIAASIRDVINLTATEKGG
jgi:integrase